MAIVPDEPEDEPKDVPEEKVAENPNTATSTPAACFMLFCALSAGTVLVCRRTSKLTK